MNILFFRLCVVVCFLMSALSEANDVMSLETVLNSEGLAYLAAREALLAQSAIDANVQAQPKVSLLQDILRVRKDDKLRFADIDAIVDRSYQSFSMLPVTEQNNTVSGRYLALGGQLAKRTQRNEVVLYLAMAELLWKTSRNAYEKRCALHVLSLSEKPLPGLYEVLRGELAKCEHPALAEDILALLTQYVLGYNIGNNRDLLGDIMFAVRQFPTAHSLHALSTRVIRDLDSPDSDALRYEIKMIAEQNRPADSEVPGNPDTPLEVEIE